MSDSKILWSSQSFDFLFVQQVDIDSFDCDIMDKVLSLSTPKVVIGEIAPLFPPPFVFIQHYQANPGSKLIIN